MRSIAFSHTGELTEDVQDTELFDPLTPDQDMDDKLYAALSDGEIQVGNMG